MPRIQANRDQVDDRFSVLGFTIRTESPLFEVAVATDPALFRADARGRRGRRNFYSSRAQGVLRARRGAKVPVSCAAAPSARARPGSRHGRSGCRWPRRSACA